MKVLVEGHRYELDGFVNKEDTQIIQFIHKEKAADSDELKLISDGTTNEEVLAMLINRMEYLYNKLPDRNSKLALRELRDALDYLEARTKERQQRGVEGTHKA